MFHFYILHSAFSKTISSICVSPYIESIFLRSKTLEGGADRPIQISSSDDEADKKENLILNMARSNK